MSERSNTFRGPPRPEAVACRTCMGLSKSSTYLPHSPLSFFLSSFLSFFLSFFLPRRFFVRLGIPFLRPDPHLVQAAARRGCQGRPSPCLGGTLHCFQAAP